MSLALMYLTKHQTSFPFISYNSRQMWPLLPNWSAARFDSGVFQQGVKERHVRKAVFMAMCNCLTNCLFITDDGLLQSLFPN